MATLCVLSCVLLGWQGHRLREAGGTDHLTGALTRGPFYARLDAALARARRRGEPLAVVALDIDDFRRVNDAHGHLGRRRPHGRPGRALARGARPRGVRRAARRRRVRRGAPGARRGGGAALGRAGLRVDPAAVQRGRGGARTGRRGPGPAGARGRGPVRRQARPQGRCAGLARVSGPGAPPPPANTGGSRTAAGTRAPRRGDVATRTSVDVSSR
nr:diguanylate cyclase [Cellulomonas sp. Y8]